MNKKDKLLLIGAILIAFGVFMFFKSTRIYSWGFYRIGNRVSTGGILIALTLFDIVFLSRRSTSSRRSFCRSSSR